MTLKTLASSSSGNCHVITLDSRKKLIVEAGIPVPDIKKGIEFDIGAVEAVIVGHGHSDHSVSCSKLKTMGLTVWQPYLDAEHPNQKTRFGEFEVRCFSLPHNGVSNRGFIIKADDTTVCYMCDLEYCPYSLESQNINVLMIECNYMSELVDEQAENYRHKVLGHCSLETCIGIIKANMKSLRTVVLLHMSNTGSFDREKGMKRIREEIPEYIGVMYATPGLEVDLDECPF